MKRLCILLALLLLSGCTIVPQWSGGGLSLAYDPSEPPTLLVGCGRMAASAWQGSYDWRYEEDGQTVNGIADADHPTAVADKLPRLEVSPGTDPGAYNKTVTLTFALQPDSISVTAHALEATDSSVYYIMEPMDGFDLLEGEYIYSIQATWKDHGTVLYAFIGSCTLPQPETTDVELAQLKKQYPQYFDLPTENGLYVFVWKMAPKGYYCGLGTTGEYSFAGEAFGHDSSLLVKAAGLTFAQMHKLLESYDIDRENIQLVPFQHPLSSYWWQTDETTLTQLELEFWGWEREGNSFPVTETCAFDVDGDGVREVCALGMGFTSGVFSFHFVVRETDSDESIVTTFVCPWYELSFVTENGVTMLRGVAEGQTHLFDIQIIDGEVSLTENGEPIGDAIPFDG